MVEFTNLGSADLADALVPGIGTGVAKSAVSLGLTLLSGDGTGSLSDVDVGDGEVLAGGGGGEIVTLIATK